jgi:hypothetical protein
VDNSFGNPITQISNPEPQKILILPADAKHFEDGGGTDGRQLMFDK